MPDVHASPAMACTTSGDDAAAARQPAPAAGNSTSAPSHAQRPERTTLLGDLQRAATTMRRHVEREILHDAGLNWTTFEVLRLVAGHMQITPGAVAANTGLSKAAITNASRILVRRGLIQRGADAADHRRAYLRPTIDGWRKAMDLGRHLSQEERRILASGAPGLPAGLVRLLRNLHEARVNMTTDGARKANDDTTRTMPGGTESAAALEP